MGLEIQGPAKTALPPEALAKENQGRNEAHIEQRRSKKQQEPISEADLESSLSKLEETFRVFSKRLKFSLNKDINRIVVKVIDVATDKVIKEIPPAEVQRLVARIKEAIGLLVDEEI